MMQLDHLSFYYCCLVCISFALAPRSTPCGCNSKDTVPRLMASGLSHPNVTFMSVSGTEAFVSLDCVFIIYALMETRGFGVRDTYSSNATSLILTTGQG